MFCFSRRSMVLERVLELPLVHPSLAHPLSVIQSLELPHHHNHMEQVQERHSRMVQVPELRSRMVLEQVLHIRKMHRLACCQLFRKDASKGPCGMDQPACRQALTSCRKRSLNRGRAWILDNHSSQWYRLA